MNTLYPFQRQGIEHLVSRDYTMLNDEQGLGKTIQAIGAINYWREKEEGFKVLIVCPASLRLNWYRELSQWLTKPAQVFTNVSTTDILEDTSITITSYNLCTFRGIAVQLMKRTFDLVIFDEAHYLKETTTATTRFYLGYFRKNYKRAIALTGTPVKNRPIELYPILKSLSPETISPYLTKLNYGRRYCKGWQAPWGWDLKGASNLDELNSRLRQGFMLRRTKAEVLPELPPRTYQLISFARDAVYADVFVRQKYVDWESLKRNVELGDDMNISMFAQMRQECAIQKLPTCEAHIHDLMAHNEKIVIFTYHREVLKKFYEMLKRLTPHGKNPYQPVIFQGGMSDKKKQEAVDTFQNDPKCRIFLGQVIAGGVGITLTQASTVVFIEASWCPADIAQAVDRIHRIGQDKPCLAQFLVVQDTIEEFVLKTALEKVKIIQGITK